MVSIIDETVDTRDEIPGIVLLSGAHDMAVLFFCITGHLHLGVTGGLGPTVKQQILRLPALLVLEGNETPCPGTGLSLTL